MQTKIGNFPIGFRRGWGEWQHASLQGLARWAAAEQFEFLDLMNLSLADVSLVQSMGVAIGTIDLLSYGRLLSTDESLRKQTIESNRAMIEQWAASDVSLYFACMLGDPARSRIDNFRLAVETFGPLCELAASFGKTIVIEGFPGAAPHFAGLGCTPESVRMLLKEMPRGLSLNYDPSHLVRLGVDPIRFLFEFGSHVRHVHAKDTQLFPEAIYELGLYQESLIKPLERYSGSTWRYCLPGRGQAPWSQILQTLKEIGYTGRISIELEDIDFFSEEVLEKSGLIQSRDFLASVET